MILYQKQIQKYVQVRIWGCNENQVVRGKPKTNTLEPIMNWFDSLSSLQNGILVQAAQESNTNTNNRIPYLTMYRYPLYPFFRLNNIFYRMENLIVQRLVLTFEWLREHIVQTLPFAVRPLDLSSVEQTSTHGNSSIDACWKLTIYTSHVLATSCISKIIINRIEH